MQIVEGANLARELRSNRGGHELLPEDMVEFRVNLPGRERVKAKLITFTEAAPFRVFE